MGMLPLFFMRQASLGMTYTWAGRRQAGKKVGQLVEKPSQTPSLLRWDIHFGSAGLLTALGSHISGRKDERNTLSMPLTFSVADSSTLP